MRPFGETKRTLLLLIYSLHSQLVLSAYNVHFMRFMTIVVGNSIQRGCFTATVFSILHIYQAPVIKTHIAAKCRSRCFRVTAYDIVLRSDLDQRLIFPLRELKNPTKSNNNIKGKKATCHQPLLLPRNATNTQYLPSKRLKILVLSTQFPWPENGMLTVIALSQGTYKTSHTLLIYQCTA